MQAGGAFVTYSDDMDVSQNNATTTVALNQWCRRVGISRMTAWRWAKAGRINPVRITNRLYLTAEDQAQFDTRMKAGEFASEVLIPTPKHRKDHRK